MCRKLLSKSVPEAANGIVSLCLVSLMFIHTKAGNYEYCPSELNTEVAINGSAGNNGFETNSGVKLTIARKQWTRTNQTAACQA